MPDLKLDIAGGIARIVLERPEVLNALSPALLSALIDRCRELSARDDVRVVVVEGAGRSFSAGADLPAFAADLDARSLETADLGRRAAEAIADLPQITIAVIHGHCVGGAIVLAAACDLRVAAASARFSIPEVDAGIPLAWGGMGRLVRLIGETRATELVLSCRPFDAVEARDAGFVSRVFDDDVFDVEARQLTEGIAARPTIVLRRVKKQLVALRQGRFAPGEDADALLEAFHDPEARAIGERYVAERIRKRD